MPLYDGMLLLKPQVTREALIDLVARVGKLVYRRNGVLNEVKSFGTVQLGYGIKSLMGDIIRRARKQYFKFAFGVGPIDAADNDDATQRKRGAALSKQGRPIAALALHRNVKYGIELEDELGELSKSKSNLFDKDSNEDEDDDDESEVDQMERKVG